MREHVSIVGWLNIGFSIIGALIGVSIAVMFYGLSMLPELRYEGVSPLMIWLGEFFIVLSLVFALPGLIGGIGVLKRQNWARVVLIIVSCFNLLSIPFGTALGIYTLWALLKEESAGLFA